MNIQENLKITNQRKVKMTRQDFIDNFLINSEKADTRVTEAYLKNMLEIRDKHRTYAQEEADINEFAKNTKNFIILKLVTPFGEYPIFVDRAAHKEVLEYMREDYLGMYKGLTLKETL